MQSKQPITLKVALDWTPNTLHSGLYLALANGFYSARNLDVQLLPPDLDYTRTPARRLEEGEVDLAICPSESCVAFQESGRMRLQAVYAILGRDASAIVSTTVARVGELGDGRVYGSYNARFEDGVVRAMVEKDGGDAKGMEIQREAGRLSLFDAVKTGEIDATWVFMPWEGVEAQQDGVKLNVFRVGDAGIPYGYSPVIARNAAAGRHLEDAVIADFVAATRLGYVRAMEHVQEAVSVLRPLCNPLRSEHFLRASQTEVNKSYRDGHAQLGSMQVEKWKAWVDWLEARNMLEKGKVRAEDLFLSF